MPFDLTNTNIISVYQTEIDNLIEQLGKDITLVFEETVSNADSGFGDKARPGTPMKPTYKLSDDDKPQVTTNTQIIKGLIKWTPKEFKDFGMELKKGQNIVRIKTYLSHAPAIKRCAYIIPNKDSETQHDSRFRLIRNIEPRGLSEDRYLVAYFEQI